MIVSFLIINSGQTTDVFTHTLTSYFAHTDPVLESLVGRFLQLIFHLRRREKRKDLLDGRLIDTSRLTSLQIMTSRNNHPQH